MTQEITNSNELAIVTNKFAVLGEQKTTIYNAMIPFFERAKELIEQSKTMNIIDVSQVVEIAQAKELRKQIKKNRTDCDKVRKDLKEIPLAYNACIQDAYNLIESNSKEIEDKLEQQEKLAENLEKERINKIKLAREQELSKYKEFVPFGLDLGLMDNDSYFKLLKGAELQLEARLKELAEAEAKRKIEQEKARLLQERQKIVLPFSDYISNFSQEFMRELGDLNVDEFNNLISNAQENKAKFLAEQKRIQDENLRLKQEAEEQEARLKQERILQEQKRLEEKKRQDDLFAQEKAKALKLQQEIDAKRRDDEKLQQEQEEKRQKELQDKIDAENKKKFASDKEKLFTLAMSIRNIEYPQCSSNKATELVANVQKMLNKIIMSLETN